MSLQWDAPKIRALRRHMGFTQMGLAAHLGVRQQTISEWENGEYAPRGASVKLLNRSAEEHHFTYQETTGVLETKNGSSIVFSGDSGLGYKGMPVELEGEADAKPGE